MKEIGGAMGRRAAECLKAATTDETMALLSEPERRYVEFLVEELGCEKRVAAQHVHIFGYDEADMRDLGVQASDFGF